jgi:hypothetical protein
VNNAGEIVGYARGSDGRIRGFYLASSDEPAIIELSDIEDTYVTGMNNRGEIVGQIGAGSATVAFVCTLPCTRHSYVPLAHDGPLSPSAINDLGVIVGGAPAVKGARTPSFFLYVDGAVTFPDLGGPAVSAGTGINDHGDVVGNYGDTTLDDHGFLAHGLAR